MNQVRLSVIIPCYNHGKYLMETLNCFPNYNQQDLYEVIIINDGSTDAATVALLNNEVAKTGVKVIHQQNQGASSARNNAIKVAKGDYILPLDSDDKISLDLIHQSIEILDNHPDYAVVYCDGEYFDEKEGPWIIGEFNLQRLMLWDYMHHGAVYRRKTWEKIGGYDPNLDHLGFEDWDLWLSIAFSGDKFYYLKKPLFSYRITKSSMVRQYTSEKYDIMLDYIRNKHDSYLSREHLTDHLATNMRLNKRLWFKLFLRTYFPKFLTKLVNKGKIDTPYVFY